MSFKDWILDVLGFEPKVTALEKQSENEQSVLEKKQTAVSLPMSDEEKERVAVIASTIIGSQQPDIRLHIANITRIE